MILVLLVLCLSNAASIVPWRSLSRKLNGHSASSLELSIRKYPHRIGNLASLRSWCWREVGCVGMRSASKVTLRSFFAPAPLLRPTRLRSAKFVASSRPMPQGLPKRRWVSSGTCFQCDAPRGSGDFILGALGAQKNGGEQTLSLSPGDHFFYAGPQKELVWGLLPSLLRPPAAGDLAFLRPPAAGDLAFAASGRGSL
jgi:hypothetical protein